MVFARVVLNDYSNKVLNVLKAKFGLKNKSEALNKFLEMFGPEIVEREVDEEYIKKVINICDRHIKKHKNKKMTIKELDKLCGV